MTNLPKSPLEIRFGFLGIKVQIKPLFWLFAGFFALFLAYQVGALANPLAAGLIIAVDIVCFLISILVGYLAPALIYRSYNLRSLVIVQDFGGGVFPEAEPPLRLQRIMVAAATPLAHLGLYALVFYSDQQMNWKNNNVVTQLAYLLLQLMNFYWAIILSLPIYPFPGGRIMLEITTYFNRKWGILFTLGFSFVLATGIAVLGWLRYFNQTPPFLKEPNIEFITPGILGTVIFTWLALRCYQTFTQTRKLLIAQTADPYDDDTPPWERS